MECFAVDSDSLIWDTQYGADDKRLKFLLAVDFETSEVGVSLFTELVVDLFALVSEIGVIFPIILLGAGLALGLVGIDILLGGLADFSLLETSRTLTLLLTFDVVLTLYIKTNRKFSLIFLKKSYTQDNPWNLLTVAKRLS